MARWAKSIPANGDRNIVRAQVWFTNYSLDVDNPYSDIRNSDFQGKYVAEDDTWKITNYVVELDRLKQAAVKQGIETTPEVIQGLKREAANIVKNTVPNYAYVGSVVKTARILPIGNFMSFPSEIIRTTTNIAEQIYYLVEGEYLEGDRPKGTEPIVTGEMLSMADGQEGIGQVTWSWLHCPDKQLGISADKTRRQNG